MLETRKARWLGATVLLAAGLGVYANSLAGPFLFDDIHSIVESPNLRHLTPLRSALGAPEGSGASGRPLVALSLALNYALGGLDVFGYHLFNVVLHVMTALALFGFTQRALRRTSFKQQALPLSFASSLLWVVHPLNSDALNLIITRNEVLPALFMLLCLGAVDRAASSSRARAWSVVAVLASSAAMLSKEIAVALPLIALAYDRSFIAGSFRAAFKARRALYLGLAASWGLLALAVASGERGVAVGFGHDLSSLDYLRTQALGLLHYLRLCVWPSGLALDYSGWEPTKSWGPALLPGACVLALFLGSLRAFVRGSKAGWVVLSLFAILAPSSSVIPITGEWLAEHRMYLPLCGVLCLLVLAGAQCFERLTPGRPALASLLTALGLGVPLAFSTIARNEVYASAITIWEDCLDKYPRNPRAHDHLAALWLERHEYARALPHARQALALDPTLYTGDYNLAVILQQLGRNAEALVHFERAKQYVEGRARFHANYGVALGVAGKRAEAIAELRRATQLQPASATAQRNLGTLLLAAGDAVGAVACWQRSIDLQPDMPTTMGLVRVLASDPDPRARDGARALSLAKALIGSGHPDPRWYDLLGMSHAQLGQYEAALEATQRALQGAQRLGQSALGAELRARVALYKREQPFRSTRP